MVQRNRTRPRLVGLGVESISWTGLTKIFVLKGLQD